MGQAIRGVPRAVEVDGSDAPVGLGAYLARQRSLRGITREELAAHTRIPLRSLERLEQGAFDGLRDGFVRGFVRTVAEGLGLDPDETVLVVLQEPPGSAARGPIASPALRRRLAALLVASLLIAAAVAWLLAGDGPSARGDRAASEVVLRRDAVRALAAEEGVLGEPQAAPGEPEE